MKLLMASDLSARSDVALQRALSLAEQLNAELTVLHVVDMDLPRGMQSLLKDNAREVLDEAVKSAETQRPVKVSVRIGDPFQTICETAAELDVDLVVLGAYRREFLKDAFVGTTAERVMRISRRPVLMVNRTSTEPYAKPMVAVDFSEMTAEVLKVAKKLGLPTAAEFSIVHAFLPFPSDRLTILAPGETVSPAQVAQCRQEALGKLGAVITTAGISMDPQQLIVREGEAFKVIQQAVGQCQADLLVMGTSGQGGIKRMLIGSVAGRLLRDVESDMLVVPAPG